MKVTSYAQSYSKELAAVFKSRTDRAAKVIADQLRANLAKTGKGSPSSPGEYPHYQSGKLYRGVRTQVGKRSPYTVHVTNRAAHADAIEEGARGGSIILPVKANVLAFTVGGKKVFAKRVKKGRLVGRHPIRRTLEECREKIRKIFTRNVDELKRGGSNKAVVRIS